MRHCWLVNQRRRWSRRQQVRSLYNLNVSHETKEILFLAAERNAMVSKKLAVLDEKQKHFIQSDLKCLLSYHSERIEGNTLSLPDTTFFLQEGRTASNNIFHDYLATRNYAAAFDFIKECAEEKKSINAYQVKLLNSILLQGFTTTAALRKVQCSGKFVVSGYYRRSEDCIASEAIYSDKKSSAGAILTDMKRLYEWISYIMPAANPIITSTTVHYNILAIQPFDHSNGHIARLLMNLVLLRKEYSPVIIEQTQIKDYQFAIERADNGDIEPFIRFIATCSISTCDMILSKTK